jgi:hypothetical protein
MRAHINDRRVVIVAALLAVLAASAAVVQLSAAAFVDTTTNGANNWASGSVTLGDNDGDAVMFNASGMVPGDTITRCIRVEYTGTVASSVALYLTTVAATNPLATDLLVTVHSGAGNAGTSGAFGDCTGFVSDLTHVGTPTALSTLAGLHTEFANGLGGWSPSSAGNRTYRISVELDPASTQTSATASYSFVWESQNT